MNLPLFILLSPEVLYLQQFLVVLLHCNTGALQFPLISTAMLQFPAGICDMRSNRATQDQGCQQDLWS